MIVFNKIGEYGRFGNQMFQIAATVSHSIKTKEEYSIFDWKYSDYFEGDFKMGRIDNISTYHEPYFHYKEIIHKNVELLGYYQSDKYFKENEIVIRKLFKPKNEIINNLKDKYKDILRNSTSIHIRRTDYTTKKDFHTNLTLGYYNNGLEKIKETNYVENVLVFSDDIEWCKENMDSSYNFINIDEITDMFLMSLCNHNIIANSSYSWWASWLNENDDKIVIAPKDWFGNRANHSTKDLYRKEMIII